MLVYEAHTGVATETPWNTMPAFLAAVKQGYKMLELDLGITKDKKIVVLHDETINNSTARNSDDSRIDRDDIYINGITLDEALEYEFGITYSNKFRGTKIALFEEVVGIAKENDVKLKIDNKFERFSDEELDVLFDAVKKSEGVAELTCKTICFSQMVKSRLGDCAIHYDGELTEENLKQLSEIYTPDKLTVWVALPCPATWWVNFPMPVEELCKMIKKYARLGIWILSDYEQLERAVELGADVIETNGAVKPPLNRGIRADMHTHSECSHDSRCPVLKMAVDKAAQGINVLAVTDHIDIEFYDNLDLDNIAEGTHNNTKAAQAKLGDKIKLLTGLEMGEAIWYPELANNLIKNHPCDVVIGSIHAVRYKELTMPYSQIDFSKLSESNIYEYMSRYFDDYEQMVRYTDCDIAAHITCPLRYIFGKYGIEINLRKFDDKIHSILSYMVRKGVALELNLTCIQSDADVLMYKHILNMYKALGGYLVTIGSDDHISVDTKEAYENVCRILAVAGFKHIYYFENRIAVQCCIE